MKYASEGQIDNISEFVYIMISRLGQAIIWNNNGLIY